MTSDAALMVERLLELVDGGVGPLRQAVADLRDRVDALSVRHVLTDASLREASKLRQPRVLSRIFRLIRSAGVTPGAISRSGQVRRIRLAVPRVG